MEVRFYCPVCLYVKREEDGRTIECNFCGSIMKSSGVSSEKSYSDVEAFVEELRSSPEFNQALFDARQRQLDRERQLKQEAEKERKRAEAQMVHCPSCGSTQIQMVPRKWSLLTGFATNKVDRICVSCKRKF